MKRGGGKGKGSAWEREVCVMLSEWWTNGKRSDIFWRSAASGARSKSRGRKGKSTSSGHGDIEATDPIGVPLTDLVTIEVKRGFTSKSLFDLVDKGKGMATQTWEEWIHQAGESCEHAGSYSWLIISRRDKRVPVVMLPQALLKALRLVDALQETPTPFLVLTIPNGKEPTSLCCLKLSDFFAGVSPKQVKELSQKV